MDWLDISRAPRDGTVVRLCNIEQGEPTTIVDMYWDDSVGKWKDPDSFWHWSQDDCGPTHYSKLEN